MSCWLHVHVLGCYTIHSNCAQYLVISEYICFWLWCYAATMGVHLDFQKHVLNQHMVNPICLLAIKIGGKENVVAACCLLINVMLRHASLWPYPNPPATVLNSDLRELSPGVEANVQVSRFDSDFSERAPSLNWSKYVNMINQWDHLEPPFVICATSHGLRKIPCKNQTAGQTSIRLYCKKNKVPSSKLT